jgi:hypothetical protein
MRSGQYLAVFSGFLAECGEILHGRTRIADAMPDCIRW